MEQVFDIIIEGQTIHKALTQVEFFEVMSDLSTAYYETGYPEPSKISHVSYLGSPEKHIENLLNSTEK